MAVISKGITLSYKKDASWVKLTNLQEIPDLGGEKESLETTTLDDAAHTYCDGLISYGDSVSFTFLYEKEQFSALAAITEEVEWKVELPDQTSCSFKGTGSVKINGIGVNEVITYALNVKPSSEMVFA